MNIVYEIKPNELHMGKTNCLTPILHLHRHIEIICVFDGTVRAVADSNEVTLRSGDVFIAFPDQLHAFYHTGTVSAVVMIFPSDILGEFGGGISARVPENPIVRGVLNDARFRSVFDELFSEKENSAGAITPLVRGWLLVFLSKLFLKLVFVEEKLQNIDSMRTLLTYCSENYAEDINLSKLERELHMSRYYISHLFKKKLGVGFSEYINMLRVSEVCRRLECETESITEIAYATGFNSLRSLNRVFLNRMSMTPREYRANHSDNENRKRLSQ